VRRLTLILALAALALPATASAESYELFRTNADGTYEWVTWGVDASSVSCKKVHVTYLKTNGGPGPFSNVLWKYGERWGWCWNGRKVTSLYGYERYVSCCDPGWSFLGHVGLWTTGWAGQWSVSRKTQGHFKFCIVWACDHDYPWVKLTLRGDGSWGRAKGN
jgi:hypothetical protein